MALTGALRIWKARLFDYSPTGPDFYFELGDGYARAGKSDEAIRWYKEALRRKPGFRPAIKQLAAALMAQRRLRAAPRKCCGRRLRLLRPTRLFSPIWEIPICARGCFRRRNRRCGERWRSTRSSRRRKTCSGWSPSERTMRRRRETRFRDALRSQPDFAEAHNNLGNVLAGDSQLPRGGVPLPEGGGDQPEVCRGPSQLRAGAGADASLTTRRLRSCERQFKAQRERCADAR